MAARLLSAACLLVVAMFGCIAFVGLPPQQLGSRSLRASWARDAMKGAEFAGEEEPAASPFRIGGVALSVLAALALAVLPMEEAQAAKSGGRIGGSAPSMKRAPPPRPSAPAASSTRNTTIINKTTVVAPPPVVAAPVMGYGGVGMMASPIVVAPAPTLGDIVVGSVVGGAINNAIYGGHHSGPSTTDRMLENQQRQDERQMDRQENEINQLKSEIARLAAEKK
eukprot:TRINITY_DN93843_c0_g1_i1.p1 TRINITY_DN93843_c0_g1~~TRINITY_DN93843_c0_g1_i1.p1  ORF type:complete len:251 (+),score=50.07 TRINITY_DN93843_c0_g1_i1:82-753(+)